MTRGADANLDGNVDSQDVSIIATHFGKGSSSGQWYFGDFDYSGSCESNDVSVLATTFGRSAPTLSPEMASLAGSVPSFIHLLGFTATTGSVGTITMDWSAGDVLAEFRYYLQLVSSTTLDWSTLTSTASYTVYWTTDPTWTTWNQTQLAADVTSINLTGLSSSTTYYLWIDATNPLNTDSANGSIETT